jgi:hypothetical protein
MRRDDLENGTDQPHLHPLSWGTLHFSAGLCSRVLSVQIARISMRALRIAELAMFDMRQEGAPPLDDVYSALRDIVLRPVKTLAPP